MYSSACAFSTVDSMKRILITTFTGLSHVQPSHVLSNVPIKNMLQGADVHQEIPKLLLCRVNTGTSRAVLHYCKFQA